MSESFNAAGQQINAVLSSFTQSLKPLGREVGKQWIQVQQFAKERIGGSTDVTELPPEYRQLEEQKVDKIKAAHEQLLKVSRNYTLPAYDYEPALNDKVVDFANTVSSGATSLADKLSGGQIAQGSASRPVSQETPPSLSHAFAKAALQAAESVNPEEPLAAALKKFANAEERAGNMRVKQDSDAVAKFHNPLLKTLNQKIADAMKARRNVQSVRLTYDACRSRLKGVPPEKAEALRTEMEKSEDEFVVAVDDAMGKMKLVVENNEMLRAIADLVAVQLQYHKLGAADTFTIRLLPQSVAEVLAELSPEIDELVITNEAIYTAGTQ
nr:hypothetical protein HK105_003865 [Polyrhizophydium stewartii]